MTQPIDMSGFFKGIREASGFNQKPICGHCEGRGVIPDGDKVVTCPVCNGTGKEPKKETSK